MSFLAIVLAVALGYGHPGPKVTGTVVDPGGAAVPGVEVYLVCGKDPDGATPTLDRATRTSRSGSSSIPRGNGPSPSKTPTARPTPARGWRPITSIALACFTSPRLQPWGHDVEFDSGPLAGPLHGETTLEVPPG
jgi:hypothetical protein